MWLFRVQISHHGSCSIRGWNSLTHTDLKQQIGKTLDLLIEMTEITKPEHSFMVVDFPVTPVLYSLPKIHKTYTDVPSDRPIVAAIGSLTENISAFVDYFLQPLVTALPSYSTVVPKLSTVPYPLRHSTSHCVPPLAPGTAHSHMFFLCHTNTHTHTHTHIYIYK